MGDGDNRGWVLGGAGGGGGVVEEVFREGLGAGVANGESGFFVGAGLGGRGYHPGGDALWTPRQHDSCAGGGDDGGGVGGGPGGGVDGAAGGDVWQALAAESAAGRGCGHGKRHAKRLGI